MYGQPGRPSGRLPLANAAPGPLRTAGRVPGRSLSGVLTVIAAWAATVLLGLRDADLTPPAETSDDRVLADDGDGWPRLEPTHMPIGVDLL